MAGTDRPEGWTPGSAALAAMRAERLRPAGAAAHGLMTGAARGVRTEGDKALDRAPRPCARCGKRFQPTVRRRLLCEPCFQNDGRAAGFGLKD